MSEQTLDIIAVASMTVAVTGLIMCALATALEGDEDEEEE